VETTRDGQPGSRPDFKVLILKPSSLGDVVQALPVLRLIKQHRPHSKVFWWVERGLMGLLEGDPDLTGIIPFNRNEWPSLRACKHMWSNIQWMRDQKFDWVIDLQSLARSGSVAWLANGKLTVGLDDPREGARCLFDHAVVRAGYDQHAVDWYLSVLPKLGVPVGKFTWLPKRAEAARCIRTRWPVEQSQWVALQPGARWLNKRWPAEYYAAVVRDLSSGRPGLRFAVLGSAEDRPLAEKICATANDRCLDLTGALSLPEMIEWIRACSLMVSNDTGPMHVAAAVGTPLLGIFGPTHPSRTGPYGQLANVVRSQVSCAPCMTDTCARKDHPLECLTSITPQRIAKLAQGTLGRC
jgi:lipopolysaccharide heptosyltransferase II